MLAACPGARGQSAELPRATCRTGQNGHTPEPAGRKRINITPSHHEDAESAQKQVACQIGVTWEPYAVEFGVGPFVVLLVRALHGQAKPVSMSSRDAELGGRARPFGRWDAVEAQARLKALRSRIR